MRLVIQRVTEASVSIGGELHSAIGHGLFILVGVECGDTEKDAEWLACKAAGLRIFDDERGVMNLSVADADGRPVLKGVFGADMQCALINDGPVTIIIDSRIRE